MPDTRDQSSGTQGLVNSRVAIQSSRGTQLFLHRIRAEKVTDESVKKPVVLAHGTFSNHRTCRGLARYLANIGYDCWLIDYEGRAGNKTTTPAATFESLFLSGTEAAINYVTQHTGRQVHWIGHSGGGLAALMSIARHPECTAQLRSLVMLGSQASDAGHKMSTRLVLRVFWILTKLLGFVPGKTLGLGPENEAAAVMLQWYGWNLQGQWRGKDKFDYTQALAQHEQLKTLPVLSMAGSGDHFIAPPFACQRLHAQLSATDKRWFECGISQGFTEDYSHGRLISSKASSREIWPLIARWLSDADARLSSVKDCSL